MKMNYCKSHCRIMMKVAEHNNTPTCQGILKSGKRKGEKCNNRCASAAGASAAGASANKVGTGASANEVGAGASANKVGTGASANEVGTGASANEVGAGASEAGANVVGTIGLFCKIHTK